MAKLHHRNFDNRGKLLHGCDFGPAFLTPLLELLLTLPLLEGLLQLLSDLEGERIRISTVNFDNVLMHVHSSRVAQVASLPLLSGIGERSFFALAYRNVMFVLQELSALGTLVAPRLVS